MIGDDTHAYRRDLPHLEKDGKTYFVTFCTRAREVLDFAERDLALEVCIRDHRVAYWLHCAVIMPDHVHLVFTAYEQYNLATIMNRIKNVSAHAVTKKRGRSGSVWQREYFDRIVRAAEDLRQKCEYVCENPARSGFPQDDRWIWRQWVDNAPPRAAAPH